MKRTCKRILILVLTLALLLSIAPAAFAVEGDPLEVVIDSNKYVGDTSVTFVTSKDALNAKVKIVIPEDQSEVGETLYLKDVIVTDDMTEANKTNEIVPYLMDGSQRFNLTKVEIYAFPEAIFPEYYRYFNESITAENWTSLQFTLRDDWDWYPGSPNDATNSIVLTWTLDESTRVELYNVTYQLNPPEGSTPYCGVRYEDSDLVGVKYDVVVNDNFSDTYKIDNAYTVKVPKDTKFTANPEPERWLDVMCLKTDADGTKTYYQFLGWKLHSDGSDTLYSLKDTVEKPEKDMTFVAQWKELAPNELVKNFEPGEAPSIPLSTFDAQIEQTADGTTWSTNTEKYPLELDANGKVSYRATLTMDPLVAIALKGQNIQSPQFAHFDIAVSMDPALQLTGDINDKVTFSFTCTFLKPSGKLVVNGEKVSNGIEMTASGTKYTFTVPTSVLTDAKGNVQPFKIPVDWNPGGYSEDELKQKIVLEVLTGQAPAGYDELIKTTGVITGSIDPSKSPEMQRTADSFAKYIGVSEEWNEAFDGGKTLLDYVRAINYVNDSAFKNITIPANTVYARLPAYDITINYLEKKTNDVLDDKDILTDVYRNTEVDLSEYLDKDIRGYRQVEVEVVTGNAVINGGEITMPSGDVVINVYYERNPIIPIIPEFPDADIPGLLNLEDHYAYIIGYDDGMVKPQNNITRAEVATIFFRLLTDEAREYFWSTDSGFSDVKSGDWYNNAVSTMVNAGIITGYSDGTFKPNANITRAEFATIAARFLSNPYSLKDRFYDTEGHWAEVYINRAAEIGWINGYSDGSFKPDQAITRAEAVTLVNNVLGRAPHEDHLLEDMIIWPDNPKSAWYYEDIQEATNSHDYVWSSSKSYEIWTELLENRNWSKLEKEWSNAYSAPGGSVIG